MYSEWFIVCKLNNIISKSFPYSNNYKDGIVSEY